jgi:hypothetical protein
MLRRAPMLPYTSARLQNGAFPMNRRMFIQAAACVGLGIECVTIA